MIEAGTNIHVITGQPDERGVTVQRGPYRPPTPAAPGEKENPSVVAKATVIGGEEVTGHDRYGRTVTTAWIPDINFYQEKRALEFASPAELDALIDLFWSDETLKGLPRVHVGRDNAIIVPAVAVPLLRSKGASFKDSRVVPAAELSNEQINRIRRERGSF